MPTNRHPIRHPHRGRLTHAQDMMLQYGYDERWANAFHDGSEHRDAWIRNRNRLLSWYRHGRRPAAWWQFESPLPYPGYNVEQRVLYQAKLLAPEERAELLAFWRRAYERAHEPHFFFCQGPGRVLEGAKARRAQYAWAGIPRELLKEWTAQRRRRSRIVRQLKTQTTKEPHDADAAGHLNFPQLKTPRQSRGSGYRATGSASYEANRLNRRTAACYPESGRPVASAGSRSVPRESGRDVEWPRDRRRTGRKGGTGSSAPIPARAGPRTETGAEP